jgi:hypothetical protein
MGASFYTWLVSREGVKPWRRNLKTDVALLEALHKAATRKVSAKELHEQRISYILALFRPDSGVTRARVLDVLAAQEGSRRE